MFVRTVAERVLKGESLRVVADQRGSPTWTVDLATSIVALLEAKAAPGIYHVTNAGDASWFELAEEVARLLGARARIEPCVTADYPTQARRPQYSVLDGSRAAALIGYPRPWRAALADAVQSGGY